MNLTPVVVAENTNGLDLFWNIRVVIAELFYHIDTAIYGFVLMWHLKII